MKRILVTGGAGFIGSHLCERLVKEGNDVICLDNFYTGSKENVWHLLGQHNFEIVRHDVCQPYWAEVDEIYNLACPASPVYYQNDPIQTTKTSVFGAYHMLGLARRTKCKILQSSTSEVYGDPNVHPQPESYWGNVNTIGLRSCYDEGKRCAETMFFDYHRLHGVRIKVIRIFNTYGPRMAENDGRVVSNFIMQALRNENITIYGDGMQTRSFQYVSDLIEGMVRMMESGDDFLGPVNIGNPSEFTMLELAEKVISMTGSKSKIVFRPLPSDDPKMRRPDRMLVIKDMDGSMHDCMLYLPIYSELRSCKIGVDEGSVIEPLESPFRHKVLFYGSSFTQGIGTCRSGMTYPMQWMRMSGLQAASVATSGRCLMQPYMVPVLEACDADAFVFDTFSNPDAPLIRERLVPFIDRLLAAHPGKPLVFQRTICRERRRYDKGLDSLESAKEHVVDSIFASLKGRPEYKDVYLVTPSAADRHETTVDGTHPEDWGYMLWARSIAGPLKKIFRKYGIK